MTPPTPGTMGQELQVKMFEGPPQRRPHRECDDQDWAGMKDKIASLYSTHQLRLVMEIMQCIYSFKGGEQAYKRQLKKWGVTKNKHATKTGDRRRQKTQRGRPDMAQKLVMVALEEVNLQSHIKQTFTFSPLSRYNSQEQILSGLDHYIRFIFSRSGGGWDANMVKFINPTGGETSLKDWERLADQCTAIEDLIKKALGTRKKDINRKETLVAKAKHMMDHALTLLPTGVRSMDPSMLIQIWQVCLRLLAIDKRKTLPYNTLGRFLVAVKGNITAARQEARDCYIDNAVEALAKVSQSETEETIRLAIFKTAATLDETIGDENAMTLSLWSLYCRTRKTSQRLQTALLAKLEWVSHATRGLPPADTINIAYYYTYAVHNVLNDSTRAARMAQDLVTNVIALPLPDELTWSTQTLAFQVCSKMWARHARCSGFKMANEFEQVKQRYEYYRVMQKAITILEKGDLVCRVSAASMAMTLGYWLRNSKRDGHSGVDWLKHADEILERIPESEHK